MLEEKLEYVERCNTNCNKWDGLLETFGEDDLHAMWVADMDFKVPQCVQSALSEYVEAGVYGYYKIPDTYYDAFTSWEKKVHQVDIKKEWIRFSPGVVSAFNWAVQIMTKPEDAVIVMTPVYYPFLNAVRNNGRKLITSELVNKDGIYSIDFTDFEDKIAQNQVKAFIMCSPHNPVGRVWREEEVNQILEICRRHKVFVIADEIHQDLTYKDVEHFSILRIADESDQMLAITAPSKTFNLAGAQNSQVVIKNSDIRKRWDAFVEGIHLLSGNVFGYIAAEAGYGQGFPWLEKVRQQIYENYQCAVEIFKRALPDVTVSPLEGTYLMWIDLSAYVKPADMEEFMQKKCKLALDYGEWFGGEQFGSFVRMNLATSRENVETGIKRIVDSLI